MITAELIREKLASDDRWLIRGILAIYERQTADEKQDQQTSHTNGQGFNSVDAYILSSFAKQIQAWQNNPNPKYPTPLSKGQRDLARPKMLKYAKQLSLIAKERA